jgi:hypothetical protein
MDYISDCKRYRNWKYPSQEPMHESIIRAAPIIIIIHISGISATTKKKEKSRYYFKRKENYN